MAQVHTATLFRHISKRNVTRGPSGQFLSPAALVQDSDSRHHFTRPQAGVDPFRSSNPCYQWWATDGEADIQAAAFRTRRERGTRFDRRPGAGFSERQVICRLLETMARQAIASGTVHRTPADFRKAIESDPIVTDA